MSAGQSESNMKLISLSRMKPFGRSSLSCRYLQI